MAQEVLWTQKIAIGCQNAVQSPRATRPAHMHVTLLSVLNGAKKMKGATGKITYRILADQVGLFDISELHSFLNE